MAETPKRKFSKFLALLKRVVLLLGWLTRRPEALAANYQFDTDRG